MRAAVDAYSWLHKGAYSCALELQTGNHYWKKQNRDAPYVNYCIHRAKMLKFFGIEPVIVFDGDRLPATKERRGETERTRAIGARQSRRRDVYVHAELRYFAEDGAGVDCGVEERRN